MAVLTRTSKLYSLALLLAHISPILAQADTCSQYSTAIPGNTLGWITTGTDAAVTPAPIRSLCAYGQCLVLCQIGETACEQGVSSIIRTCTPQWSAYSCSQSSYYSASVSGDFTSYYTYTAVDTIVNSPSSYPTTVPSNRTYTYASKYYSVTFEPVYVFGNTAPQTSLSTYVAAVFTQVLPSRILSGLYPVPTPICSATDFQYGECPCSIVAGASAQIYYWPDQTPGPDGSFPAISSNPDVSVLDGITMTSPSVYIRFPTLRPTDYCSYSLGPTLTNAIVSVRPSEISSLYYGVSYASVYNFADLGPTVNPDAYERQASCFQNGNNGCRTIYPYYAPPISIPSAVLSLDPSWNSCGVYARDGASALPPISIRPLQTAVVPTTTAITTTTSPITSSNTTLARSTIRRPTPCSTPTLGTPSATQT